MDSASSPGTADAGRLSRTPSGSRYRVVVCYDGTRFVGWQRQPRGVSIQSELERVLAPLAAPLPAPVVHGSGRTDAGVHARGQVAHFDLERDIAPVQLRRAMNGGLPPEIQVLDADHADAAFDARRGALGKEYRYRIWNAEVLPPDLRLYTAHVRRPLCRGALRAAAAEFVGTHDFAAFSANPHREVASTVRRIWRLDLAEDGPLVELQVEGDGFLYKMVRSIAGFLIAVGSGKEPPSAVREVMASRVRTARVESAPPQGLFLWRVRYPAADEPAARLCREQPRR